MPPAGSDPMHLYSMAQGTALGDPIEMSAASCLVLDFLEEGNVLIQFSPSCTTLGGGGGDLLVVSECPPPPFAAFRCTWCSVTPSLLFRHHVVLGHHVVLLTSTIHAWQQEHQSVSS